MYLEDLVATQPAAGTTELAARPATTRWPAAGSGVAIAVIAGAQLMVALDVTIVNIALPHIQAALHFSRPSLAWVIDAYTLVFGGLMLLGGRAADFLGRKRMFILGLTLFSLASLVGGLATSAGVLIAARAAQGVGGAIASPTALSLVTTVFPEGKPRNRALAAYAGATGGGGVLGLIAGGLLTDLLSWRWVLFVNVIIGGLLVAAAPRVIPDTPRAATGRPSVLSAALSVIGVGALVYGFLHAASDSWRSPVTIGAFALAATGIAAFALLQARSSRPLLPLRLFRNRNRVGSHLMGLAIGAAIFSMFYFLTQFVQEILGYSPIKAGLAFLPLMVLLGLTAQAGGRLISRTGPKPLLVFGATGVLIALLLLSRISAGSTYVAGVLPALLVLGIGVGAFFVPLAGTAVAGVASHDAGIASATYNMFFQIGGAIGLAALTTVASTSIHDDLAHRPAGGAPTAPAQLLSHALAHGWGTAFAAGAGFAALALIVALAVVHVRTGEINPAHVH
jgi:EmrB/QacA subfamily drug resistance transporter